MKLKVIVHDAAEGGSFEELLGNLYEAVEGCLSVDVTETASTDTHKVLEIAV